jgi:hypothetical protein
MSRIGAGCAPHLMTQRLPRPSTPSRSGHLFVSPTGARTCVSAGPKAKAATGAALELAEAYFCAPAIKSSVARRSGWEDSDNQDGLSPCLSRRKVQATGNPSPTDQRPPWLRMIWRKHSTTCPRESGATRLTVCRQRGLHRIGRCLASCIGDGSLRSHADMWSRVLGVGPLTGPVFASGLV